jgi:hypothetical protein
VFTDVYGHGMLIILYQTSVPAVPAVAKCSATVPYNPGTVISNYNTLHDVTTVITQQDKIALPLHGTVRMKQLSNTFPKTKKLKRV